MPAMQVHHRPVRTLPVLLAAIALLVASAACSSDEESFSGITETGVTQPYDPSTDTTAMTGTRPAEDTTTTTAEPVAPTVEGQPAYVRNFEVLILEIFPPQVSVEISGDHPTPCHETFTEVTADGNDYEIEVWSLAPESDFGCAAVLEPFVEVVHLADGEGFEPGEYTVTVNGETQPFTI